MLPLANSYSPQFFNILPALEVVCDKSKERDTPAIINDVIGPLFLKYNLLEHFGVQLLHRHFDLDTLERLVDVGGASIPWNLGHSPALDEHVHPASWGFDGDTLRPYEFYFSAPGKDHRDRAHDVPDAFLVELNDILCNHNLQDVLGLRLLKENARHQPELEISQGRANVTFDYEPTVFNEGDALEASWGFDAAGKPSSLSYCVSYCSTRSDYGAHHKYHSRQT